MKLNDFHIRQLAENIIDHKYILTDEVVQLALLYDYLEQYFTDIKSLVEFYESVKDYTFNLRYGDLDFFRDLLESNHAEFIEITEKMEQVKSIEEMNNTITILLLFIDQRFNNTHIKADFLEYSSNFLHYVESITIHNNALIKSKKL